MLALEEPVKVSSPAVVEVGEDEVLASDEVPGEEEKCGGCGDNKNKPVLLNKKCRDCGCRKCGGKNEPNSQIMCDECSCAYHLACIGEPNNSTLNDTHLHRTTTKHTAVP